MRILKKIGGIALMILGVALSILWIVKDPGFQAVFSNSVIFIGFFPLSGVIFGFLVQLIPAAGGIFGGLYVFNE